MAVQKSLYDVLGLTTSASSDAIRERADEMLLKLRSAPVTDDAGNEQKFVAYARETLCDPIRRAKYDKSLRERVASLQPKASRSNADRDASGSIGSSASTSLRWIAMGLAALAIAGLLAFVTAKKRASAPSTAPAPATPIVQTGAPNPQPAPAKVSEPASSATPNAEFTASEIFKMNEGSVVVVRGGGGMTGSDSASSQGSGVVIAEGEVVTNCHVAGSAREITVRLGTQSLPAKVRYRDQGHDLCQLTVPGLKAQAVKIAPVSSLSVGSRVYAIGAPQGLDLSLSDGVVSSLRPFSGSTVIQTTAAISPGSSGGGLFDSKGQLVGVTTFQMRTGQNLNFAVPSDWIELLAKRDGNTDSLLPQSATAPPPAAAIAGAGPVSAETENRRRLLVGKWDCHRGAKAENRQIQYEFASDNTMTLRTKKPNAEWDAIVGRFRLVSESTLILDDPHAQPSQVALRLVQISSTSAVLEWQMGERAVHYCSR
ncbi:MAG: hypothetical protein EAZ43_11580 [Betaproteobacteria bacterium]|nr:MAG: hypothetical protein EAZ43_11580 [Betaproteobacteria bacterium]